MNLDKSVSCARSPTCFRTYSASIVTVVPLVSGAENEISSKTRSITVCNRRAPIFSTDEFKCTATSANSSIASSVNSSVTSSVFINATYCLIKLASVSVKIRRKSSFSSARNSTRIGNRPCSSGRRSDGLATWNAPDATNKM